MGERNEVQSPFEGTGCTVHQPAARILGEDPRAIYHVVEFSSAVLSVGPTPEDGEDVGVVIARHLMGAMADEELRDVVDIARGLLEGTERPGDRAETTPEAGIPDWGHLEDGLL